MWLFILFGSNYLIKYLFLLLSAVSLRIFCQLFYFTVFCAWYFRKRSVCFRPDTSKRLPTYRGSTCMSVVQVVVEVIAASYEKTPDIPAFFCAFVRMSICLMLIINKYFENTKKILKIQLTKCSSNIVIWINNFLVE